LDDAASVNAGTDTPVPGHNASARLEVIKTDIQDAHRNYRTYAERTARYAVMMGQRLIEAKTIVGHGHFESWVKTNCPFGLRMGNHYMQLARSEMKPAMIADIGLRAASEGFTDQLRARASSLSFQTRKAKQRDDQARKWNPPVRGRRARRLERRAKERVELKVEREQQTADALEEGLPDPHREWLRPRKNCQALLVEWPTQEDGSSRIAYVWRPEDADAMAASSGRPGPGALRYRLIVLQLGSSIFSHKRVGRVEVDADWGNQLG
jgi:hypothetical protein